MAGHGWSTGAYKRPRLRHGRATGVYSCVGCANTGGDEDCPGPRSGRMLLIRPEGGGAEGLRSACSPPPRRSPSRMWSEAGGQGRPRVVRRRVLRQATWTATGCRVRARGGPGPTRRTPTPRRAARWSSRAPRPSPSTPPRPSVSVAEDADAGAFEVTVSGVSSPSGVSRVDVPVVVGGRRAGRHRVVPRAVPQADGTYRR